MVYLSAIFPCIPESGVVTCSLCTGSYISKALGTIGFGKVNSFRFPLPETLISKSNDSPCLNSVLEGLTTKLNFPTAPVKSCGFPASGKAFTLITLLPAETVLLPVTNWTLPKISLLLVGWSTTMSKESGSMVSLPDF